MVLNTSYQIYLQVDETDDLEKFAKCSKESFLAICKAKEKLALNDCFPVKKWMLW